MKFEVKETHDGKVYLQAPTNLDGECLCTPHEALTLAIQLIVSASPLSAAEVAKALEAKP